MKNVEERPSDYDQSANSTLFFLVNKTIMVKNQTWGKAIRTYPFQKKNPSMSTKSFTSGAEKCMLIEVNKW